MNQQEPLDKEEFQTIQDSTEPIEPVEPVEPLLHDHSMYHNEGLVEPKIKEYVPLEVGMVIFTIVVLALIFVGIFSNMWGLID
ncbi:hypothetical protein QWY16_09150 [Planococcus shenhongbingii]|uniref:hypothetical protein n=1 Tax=Planococcus shenhongbingii TaxID=3058398 RepID=UPI002635E3F8|nr:hypothetical protein [Planococcus sp. N016]WKA60253.1 hypothetical protein QWY16_09150 [Planococcus sp. N016]